MKNYQNISMELIDSLYTHMQLLLRYPEGTLKQLYYLAQQRLPQKHKPYSFKPIHLHHSMVQGLCHLSSFYFCNDLTDIYINNS